MAEGLIRLDTLRSLTREHNIGAHASIFFRPSIEKKNCPKFGVVERAGEAREHIIPVRDIYVGEEYLAQFA